MRVPFYGLQRINLRAGKYNKIKQNIIKSEWESKVFR